MKFTQRLSLRVRLTLIFINSGLGDLAAFQLCRLETNNG